MLFSFDVLVGESELLRVILKRVIAQFLDPVDRLGLIDYFFEIDIVSLIRQFHDLLIKK